MNGRATRRLRRLDLFLIALAAPIWIPVFAIIGVAVLVTSGRPILFRQDRVGRDGNVFSMRKFRSMHNGDNPLIPEPDRITRIGKTLRRTSLDELPQLLNVLDGSMSLVGPRPLLPVQQAAMSPEQARRHNVSPGLTGLAQVSGRNSLSWDERFVYDVDWASSPSITRYLSILRRTARTVLGGAGVDGHPCDDRVLIQARSTVLDLEEILLPSETTTAAPTPVTKANTRHDQLVERS